MIILSLLIFLLQPPDGKDTARLVLWYKNKDPQPVYSFDARFSTVKHWSEDPAFGARSFFRDSVDPAELILRYLRNS